MPSPWRVLACVECGQEWKTRKPTARTCSPKCRAQLREREHGPTKGREPRDYPTEIVEHIRELYESGMTRAEVQAKIGRGIKVENVMRRYKIQSRPAIPRIGMWVGEKNPQWRGDAAGYQALHLRVEAARGKPAICAECGRSDGDIRYEWANLTGDYATRVCASSAIADMTRPDDSAPARAPRRLGGDALCLRPELGACSQALDAGGLDMAVERVFGGHTVWHSEVDSAASKVLAHRWPGVPNTDGSHARAGAQRGGRENEHSATWLCKSGRGCNSRLSHRAPPDSAGVGWDEGRPESAGLVGGSDAAVSGTGPVELLPTPCAGDGMAGRTYGRNGTQINLKGIARVLAGDSTGLPDCDELRALLPTPRSSECFGPGLHGDGGMDLRTTVTLLPTPKTTDLKGTDSPSDHGRHSPNLSAVSYHTAQWGKYEPAIRRWENLTRPAPSPTEPNTKGNPRLSAEFSQWMMGWPAGWVTDVPGISRNDALRIIGNGVCPQQAIAALRYLLSVCEVAA